MHIDSHEEWWFNTPYDDIHDACSSTKGCEFPLIFGSHGKTVFGNKFDKIESIHNNMWSGTQVEKSNEMWRL